MLNHDTHSMRLTDIRLVHQGSFLSCYEMDYKDSAGNAKTYEMISRSGSIQSTLPPISDKNTDALPAQAVTLMVLNEEQTKMLVPAEFRMAINRFVVNQISGLIDEGEDEDHAAVRELFEETGLELAEIIDKLPPAYSCAGISDDMATQIICTARGELRGSNSVNEEINCEWMDKEQIKELLSNCDISIGGRCQAYMYMWAHHGT